MKLFRSIVLLMSTLCLSLPSAFSQGTVIFNEPFDNLDSWSPAPDNGEGCSWHVVNGAARIENMGYNPDGWISAVYETPLTHTIPPGTDFDLKAYIRVQDGDPSGWSSGVGVQLMDENNNRVVRINFNDSQAASGYGGLQYGTGLGMVYTNDPNGFSTNNPTLDGLLEIRRRGITWTAYFNGEQLGSPKDFDVPWTATKVQITNGQYKSYHYRDGEIDYIQVVLPQTPGGLTCFYTGDSTSNMFTQALNELGFSITFSTTWPDDLSVYSLVVCSSYSMCTQDYATKVGDYVTNGGGAILTGGTPSSFGGGGYSCSNIASWFGTANYANVGDCYSKINYDHPLGTSLLSGDTIAEVIGYGAAAVTNVYSDCDVLSSYTSGPVNVFIRSSGAGRVAFTGNMVGDYPAAHELIKAIFSWLARLDSAYLSVSPQSVNVDAGSGTFTLSVNANVVWSVTDNAGWLTASKSDDHTVTVQYQENPAVDSRTAVITLSAPDVSPQQVVVTQEGAAPVLEVAPDSASVGPESGTFDFSVTANVSWSVSEEATWASVEKEDSSSFTVAYEKNSSVAMRSVDLMVESVDAPTRVVTLTQQGSSPQLTVTPSSAISDAAGDTLMFRVSANVSWNVSSGSSWLEITKTDTTFTVITRENGKPAERTAYISVTGTGDVVQTVVIRQAGASPYLSVDRDSVIFPAAGQEMILYVEANVPWDLSVSVAWVTLLKLDSSRFKLTCLRNLSVQERSGEVTLQGEGTAPVVIHIAQEAAAPYLMADRSADTVSAEAGAIRFKISSNISWAYDTDDDWLTLEKTDSATLQVSFLQNTEPAGRTALVRLTGEGVPSLFLVVVQEAVKKDLSLSWVVPSSQPECGTSGDELITVRVYNHGQISVGNFQLQYSTDNGKSYVTETVYNTVSPGSQMDYTFSHRADMRSAGIYVCRAVVVLTGDQNPSNDTVTVMVTNDPVTVEVETYETICNDSTGAIQITGLSGGEMPYTVFWSTGDSSQWEGGSSLPYLEELPSGEYQVTVKDARGCSDFVMAVVNDAGGPKITQAEISDVSCYQGADGAIDISVISGAKPYDFRWSNGMKREDLSGLSAGSYSVTVVDNNGCTVRKTFRVDQPKPILITASVTDANCGEANGHISLEIEGGSSPYSYVWSNGDTVPDPGDLAGGAYTVVVTDMNGCTAKEEVVVNENGAPLVGISRLEPAGCGMAIGSVSLEVNGDSAGLYKKYTFLWNTGDTLSLLNHVYSGHYTVTVRERSSNCMAVMPVEVPLKKPPAPSLCLITVDSLTERNKILIHREESEENILGYNVYRESFISGQYEYVGFVKRGMGGTFIDSMADPAVRAWKYKITLLDVCGSESSYSLYHKTMHLMMNEGINNEVNLIWTGYEGFDYNTYTICRVSQNGVEEIAEIPGEQGVMGTYTDLNPPEGTEYYYVKVESPYACSGTAKTSHNSSRSNRRKYSFKQANAVTGPEGQGMTIGLYPNPASGVFYLTYHLDKPERMLISIFDAEGRLIYDRELWEDTGDHTRAFSPGLSPGLYHLKIRVQGSVIHKMIVFQ